MLGMANGCSTILVIGTSVPSGDPCSTKRGTACDTRSETTEHGDFDNIGKDSKGAN